MRYVLLSATLVCLAAQRVDAGGVDDWFARHGKGKLEYKLFWHTGTRPQDGRKRRSECRFTLELNIPVSDDLRVFVAPDLRWSSHDMSAGTFDELNRDEVRRPIFHFKEAYVEWSPGPWEVRLGEQIFAWGTADGFNPTDNLNPRDYLDLLDNEKIPVLALSATYHFSEATSLQFVLIPLFTPSRFDGQDSRWSFFPAAPPRLNFERHLPGDSLSNLQWGARLKTSAGGWDFSVSYFDGYDDIGRPTLGFRPTFPLGPGGPMVPVPDTVHSHYDKVRILGCDFATTWNDIGIHGEIAHVWTDGRRNDNYLQYVLGIDYTFADLFPGQNLRLILEYAGEHVTRKGRALDGVPPTGIGRSLDHSVLGRAVYEINERAAIELQAVFNLGGGKDFYLQPSFRYDVRDDLRIVVGADILSGSADTFFGQFDSNDRIFFIVEYYF